MAETFHRNFFLAGPAGRLEAMLWTVPLAHPPLVAVVCHPHPLFGGTMHNKVAYQAAKALHLPGIPVLRFNFRGAGLSEGVHDRGVGEQDDVRAALDWASVTAGLVGLTSRATIFAVGTNSCSNSSRFGSVSKFV